MLRRVYLMIAFAVTGDREPVALLLGLQQQIPQLLVMTQLLDLVAGI